MIAVATDLLNRAKQEYREMPGLLLTTRQASRLWNLDAGVCHALLSALVNEEFLSETRDGAYVRRGDGAGPPGGAATRRLDGDVSASSRAARTPRPADPCS